MSELTVIPVANPISEVPEIGAAPDQAPALSARWVTDRFQSLHHSGATLCVIPFLP